MLDRAAIETGCEDAAPACVGGEGGWSVWLRVSLAVWRRVELEPVLATDEADYARHWRGYIATLCAPRALVARGRQRRLKDGRGADLESAVSEYCRHFCSG